LVYAPERRRGRRARDLRPAALRAGQGRRRTGAVRLMDRRTTLIVALLAVVALATQALVWMFVPREVENVFVGAPRSDYTLANFTLDALDEQGRHNFTMVAPRLSRKEDDGSIYVTAPN